MYHDPESSVTPLRPQVKPRSATAPYRFKLRRVRYQITIIIHRPYSNSTFPAVFPDKAQPSSLPSSQAFL